jgi:hypothetical protein
MHAIKIGWSIGTLLTLTCIWTSTATAQERPAETSGRGSGLDLRDLVQDVAAANVSLREVRGEEEMVQADIDEWSRDRKAHNDNQCVFPEGEPEVCDWYEAEKKALDERRDGILRTVADLKRRRETLQFRISNDRALIRVARVGKGLQGFEDWVRRVVACAELSDLAAANCLDGEWQNHP